MQAKDTLRVDECVAGLVCKQEGYLLDDYKRFMQLWGLLGVVWGLFGGCLEVVWRLFGGCLRVV